MNKDALKILAFTNGTASHIWRFDPIARRFNSKTKHEMMIVPHDAWNQETLGADIVILEMVHSQHMVDTCHNLGAKVIYEADDAFIDTYGKERAHLMHFDEKDRRIALETIRKCDALTVTNETLAKNYRRYTDKPIYVLPIYMDYDYYKEVIDIQLPERNTDEVRVGWFGGEGHLEDLKMILPALKNVLKKHPHVKFVYCGYGGAESEKLSTSLVFGEDVLKELPREQREYMMGVPEDYWKFKHRFMALDIGLCPLIDDDFNRCKVPTKWFEYSALETATVCSQVVYDTVVQNKRNGLLAKSVNDWEQALDSLIKNETLRKKIGQQAAKDVFEKHNIDNHWLDWESTYQKVVTP